MKRTALALVLLLSACGGGDDGTVTTSGAKSEPKVEKPKNPLDKSENRTACASARREVSERAGVFGDLADGTALPEDAVKAAGKLQQETGDAGSYATGSIRTNLLALSDAYGRMRVTLTTGDLDGLAAAVGEQNAALEALDKDCSSIGE